MIPTITTDHDRHLATVALAARLGDGPAPLSPTKYWELVEASDGDPTRAVELGDENARRLLDRQAIVALHVADLKSQAISVVTPFHEQYPARYLESLGKNAPPLLYGVGDLATAAHPEAGVVGVVGSRSASDSELSFAEAIGKACASGGLQLISGGAKGVDAAGLNAAWSAGGFVLAVLAEGVRRAIRRRALRQLISDGQGAILSAVHPDAGFSVGAAMGRNKLIYAAADLTVVVAVEEGNGGTWNGATEALRRSYGRVAVRRGAEAETALLDRGAVIIEAPDGVRDLPALVASKSESASPVPVPAEVEQESLF